MTCMVQSVFGASLNYVLKKVGDEIDRNRAGLCFSIC